MYGNDARSIDMDDTGGEHIPVLKDVLVERLSIHPGSVVYDLTVGNGGHLSAIGELVGSEGTLVGLDVDPKSLERSRARLKGFGGEVRLFRENFREVRRVREANALPGADVVLADLGFCSGQLTDFERGLSFQTPGPLDMRLDSRLKRTAGDLLQEIEEEELANLIFRYGEERGSRRIARAIVDYRNRKAIGTTSELAMIVCKALNQPLQRAGRKRHPATRTFQALRIAVNDELGALEEMLEALPDIINAGGMVAVISFHSLEDRIVKLNFKAHAKAGVYEILTKKPLEADREEVQTNPRSRSAKLRISKRLDKEKGVSK